MATHHVCPANDTVSARLAVAQPLQPAADVVGRAPLGDLGLGQRAEHPQQVGDALGVAGRAILAEVLQLRGGASR